MAGNILYTGIISPTGLRQTALPCKCYLRMASTSLIVARKSWVCETLGCGLAINPGERYLLIETDIPNLRYCIDCAHEEEYLCDDTMIFHPEHSGRESLDSDNEGIL